MPLTHVSDRAAWACFALGCVVMGTSIVMGWLRAGSAADELTAREEARREVAGAPKEFAGR